MHICEIVEKLVRRYGTRNPYELADYLGISLFHHDLGSINGYYYKAYRTKMIFLNCNLEPQSPEEKYVLAHEIGHAILHPNANTPFIRSSTYLSVDRMELEANKFAVELLVPNETIFEYMHHQGYTANQLSRLLGYRTELIELKLK